MRTFIRIVISVVAGFILMWPLGYVYGVLKWPTFHAWGLMHGSFAAAWPTLSILTFLTLGYVRFFPRAKDTALLIFGLVWGLLLTGFLGVGSYMSAWATYSLLAATTAIIAALSFFARHKLRMALLAISPVVFLRMDFLLSVMSPGFSKYLPMYVSSVFDIASLPLLSALIGWALGSLGRAFLKGPPAAA